MAPVREDNVVGRDELIADGEDDRSGIEAKDDAALLVSLRKTCSGIYISCRMNRANPML